MSLSKSDKDKVKQWTIEKKISGKCGECGCEKPSIVDWISVPSLSKKGEPYQTVPIQMVTIACSDCGHIRLFSAVFIGLIPPHSITN